MTTSDSNVIRCPSCGARDVRNSMPRGILDTIVGALGRSPFRCRQCQRRFYKRVPQKEKEEESDRAVLRHSDED